MSHKCWITRICKMKNSLEAIYFICLAAWVFLTAVVCLCAPRVWPSNFYPFHGDMKPWYNLRIRFTYSQWFDRHTCAWTDITSIVQLLETQLKLLGQKDAVFESSHFHCTPGQHKIWKWTKHATPGLFRWHNGKESPCQRRRHKRCGFHLWVGKMPWRRKWQPTPVFLPGKSHG